MYIIVIIIRKTATLRVLAKLSARGRCRRQRPVARDGDCKDSLPTGRSIETTRALGLDALPVSVGIQRQYNR